jgi:hypothetical protein
MEEKQLFDQRRALLDIADNIPSAVKRSFTGSREGFEVVDVNEYLNARDLILLLFRTLDSEVHRVCFEERLSNRSWDGD